MARQIHRVIVEGMDGSGKTVLVNHLTRCFPELERIVNEKGPDQDFSIWWPEILDKEQDGSTPIHDRFFYSELVYGPIIRGHINAEPNLITNVLWFLRAGSLLIYARPHTDYLKKGIEANKQMEGVTEKTQQLLELYDQLMAAEKDWYKNRFFHYVWHRDGELDRVTEIVRGYLAGELG